MQANALYMGEMTFQKASDGRWFPSSAGGSYQHMGEMIKPIELSKPLLEAAFG